MGVYVDFSNFIEIGLEHWERGPLRTWSWRELTPAFLDGAAEDGRLTVVQISRSVPEEALARIDDLLVRRPDLTFRVYGLHGEPPFDLRALRGMPHLRRLTLDVHTAGRPEVLNCEVLGDLAGLKALTLDLFDWKDYSFIRDLPVDLEELGVFANTIKGGIVFDCGWLARFPELHTLRLGMKAKKNIGKVGELPALKALTLRGIKLPDLEFLRERQLESLAIWWCGMNDLRSLDGFASLRTLELWRIMKLEDLSFLPALENLETLRLRDLSHIRGLPDLSGLTKLRELVLENMHIDPASLPETLRDIVRYR